MSKFTDFVVDQFTDASGQFSLPKTARTAAGLAALYGSVNPDSSVGEFLGVSGKPQGPIGYTGGIPKYTATRSLLDNAFDNTDRRPGSKGRSYFGDTVFTKAATPTATDAPAPAPASKKPISPADLPADADLLAAFAAADAAGVDIPETVQASTQAGLNRVFGSLNTGAGSSPEREDYTESLAVFEDEPKNTASTPTTLDLSNLGPAIGPEDPLAAYKAVDIDQDYTQEERDLVAKTIMDRAVDIPSVADRFGVSNEVIASELIRGGYSTPEQLVTLGQLLDENFDEPQLIYRLLEAGQTTPEEVAAYYQDHPIYGGMTPEQVVKEFRAMGGTRFAMGGMAMGGPNYLAGATDGMADLVPATIGDSQPAALSDGEFVIPADVVSHLGNGNSDAGAKQLYSMMDRVRDERTGTTRQGPEINPTKMMPA